jgi:hypothetical protein
MRPGFPGIRIDLVDDDERFIFSGKSQILPSYQ